MLKMKPYFDNTTKKFHVESSLIVNCAECNENSENLICVRFNSQIIITCVNCEETLLQYKCKNESDRLEIVW